MKITVNESLFKKSSLCEGEAGDSYKFRTEDFDRKNHAFVALAKDGKTVLTYYDGYDERGLEGDLEELLSALGLNFDHLVEDGYLDGADELVGYLSAPKTAARRIERYFGEGDDMGIVRYLTFDRPVEVVTYDGDPVVPGKLAI